MTDEVDYKNTKHGNILEMKQIGHVLDKIYSISAVAECSVGVLLHYVCILYLLIE